MILETDQSSVLLFRPFNQARSQRLNSEFGFNIHHDLSKSDANHACQISPSCFINNDNPGDFATDYSPGTGAPTERGSHRLSEACCSGA
jgi:hypothetical protein